MPAGGAMEIRTRRRENELLIILTDSGHGMTAETMHSVTLPFFTARDDGSGLGLPLCTRILEEHGARLDITSEEGVGTIITIILNIPTEETHGPTAGG
jgi:signal transduction histidine kinase